MTCFQNYYSCIMGEMFDAFFYQRKILWQELKSYGYWIVYLLVVPTTSTIREKLF